MNAPTACFMFAHKTKGEHGSPLHWMVQTVAMLRSGIICFALQKNYLHE